MDFANDIPLDLARLAHAGTSFDPEQRAESERAGYAGALRSSYEMLEKYAGTPEKKALLEVEFARYRAGYAERYRAYLSARSRCMSTMITGGSNFPVRRNEKRNATADKRAKEVQEFQGRALAAIKKKLTPELQPIMAGDDDATERLDANIVKLEALQAQMKAANAAIRKNAKAGPEAQVAALVELGLAMGIARQLLVPDFAGRIGFASYQLTNLGANIRRLKGRLGQVSEAKQAPEQVVEGANGIRVEDSPADNRVRIFFPGKPEASVRADLKAHGFRWTPSLGCWQAYRNHNALSVAQKFGGI